MCGAYFKLDVPILLVPGESISENISLCKIRRFGDKRSLYFLITSYKIHAPNIQRNIITKEKKTPLSMSSTNVKGAFTLNGTCFGSP